MAISKPHHAIDRSIKRLGQINLGLPLNIIELINQFNYQNRGIKWGLLTEFQASLNLMNRNLA